MQRSSTFGDVRVSPLPCPAELATLTTEVQQLTFPNLELGSPQPYGEATLENALEMLEAKVGRGYKYKRHNKTKVRLDIRIRAPSLACRSVVISKMCRTGDHERWTRQGLTCYIPYALLPSPQLYSVTKEAQGGRRNRWNYVRLMCPQEGCPRSRQRVGDESARRNSSSEKVCPDWRLAAILTEGVGSYGICCMHVCSCHCLADIWLITCTDWSLQQMTPRLKLLAVETLGSVVSLCNKLEARSSKKQWQGKGTLCWLHLCSAACCPVTLPRSAI